MNMVTKNYNTSYSSIKKQNIKENLEKKDVKELCTDKYKILLR